MAKIEIRITDNSNTFKGFLKTQSKRALKNVGEAMRGYAVLNAPVRTGDLRRSITVEEHELDVSVGVPEGVLEGDYAKYVELGTRYQDAQYFLTRAAEEHLDTYKILIERELKR